mgnify:CR=1 FL=1
MDFLNFLMALSPIVVVLVGILGFKKSAKTVSPIALAWTLILAFTYFNLDGLTFAENVKVLDPLVWKGIKEGLKIVLMVFGAFTILNLLRDINQRLNLTIVMITHQMEVVKEICDRVAVIENGSIIEEGNMIDVFTNPQNQTTKEFVKSVDKNNLPESLKSTPVSREYFEGANLAVRLSFFSGNADKPIVSGMIKRFGVDANIISGNTDQLKDRIYGNLLIVIEGQQKALEDSLDYLNSQNLQVEVIGYVK